MKREREPLPCYPVAAAAFPVLSVYAANLAYVPVSQVVRPLLAAAAAAALLTLGFGLALRSAARGAAAATALVLWTFAFAWFRDHTGGVLSGVDPTVAWGIVAVLIAGLAAWRLTTVRALNVLASAVVVVALANLGLSLLRANQLSARSPRAALGAASVATDRPDVFYIVLDGHGRSDSIRRAIGYDNAAFVEGLQKRGFYVADRAHSNYVQTELSLSSSLNMDFVQDLLPNVKPGEIERKPLEGLIDDSEVVRRFRAKGYRFVAVTSGFPPVSFPDADLHLGSHWGGSMIETTLLQMTPFARGGVVESQFVARRKNLIGAFENLGSLAAPTASPRLVIAHILAPHPPFVFGPNGETVRQKGGFGFWDGDDYTTFADTSEAYQRGYAGQVAWVEKQTLAAIDLLLSRPGPKPIIIVQGDHGSKLHLAQNSLAKTDLHECFPILNAYLVPNAIRKDLRPDITPVNSFRLVLHDLFGDDLPPLPDRSWYSRYATPYDFTEVTSRIGPVKGATLPTKVKA